MRIQTQGPQVTPLAGPGGYRAQLEAAFKSALGADLSVDPTTPQGQIIGILALTLAQQDEAILQSIQGLNLYSAAGYQLDSLGSLLDIARVPARHSLLPVRFIPTLHLGPVTNTFSGTTLTLAAAARDAYATANSTWLAQYDADSNLLIRLRYGTGSQQTAYYRRRSGAWEDVTTTVNRQSVTVQAGAEFRESASAAESYVATEDITFSVVQEPTANLRSQTETDAPFSGTVGTALTIVNTTANLGSVITTGELISGGNGQTDVAYRTAIFDQLAIRGGDGLEHIRSALLALDDVQRVRIEENTANFGVTRRGKRLPANSVYVVVEGKRGNNANTDGVGRAILAAKPAGIATSGDISQTITHGTAGRGDTGISWDNVERRPLSVRVSIRTTPEFPNDGIALIQSRCADYIAGTWTGTGTDQSGIAIPQFETSGTEIGQSFDANRLLAPIYSVPGHSLATPTPAPTPNVNPWIREKTVLGPATNTFAAATVTAAETARDTYATANASWLAQYDADQTLSIAITETTGNTTVYQVRSGGAWVATTSILTIPPDDNTDLDWLYTLAAVDVTVELVQ